MGYPTSGLIDRDHRAAQERSPRVSSPQLPHTPPQAVAAAQVPRGLNPVGTSNRMQPDGELYSSKTTFAVPAAHLSRPLTRQLQLCDSRSMAVARQMHP